MPDGSTPGGSYAAYAAQYAPTVDRTRPPDTYRPLFTPRPITPPRRRRTAAQDTLARLLGMLPNADSYGAVLTDEQIRAKAQADAMGILGPLLDRENSDYAARVAQGSEAVKGYTNFFADRLGQLGGQVSALYDRQRGIMAGVGDALSTGQGKVNQGGIDSLSAALSAMNAPNAGGTVAQQGELSAGGTRLTKTLSATELQRLANEGTAQESLAAQQPGIAVLEGGQTLRDYLTQMNNQRASAIADINGQAPSLAQALFSQYYGANSDRQSNRASAQAARAQLAASWLGSQADRNQNAEIFKITQIDKEQAEAHRYQVALANAGTSAARARVTAEHNRIMEQIAQQNADSSTTSANASATRAAKAGQKKAVTWRDVVSDAQRSAKSQTAVGAYGQQTRPGWQQAYNNLYRYLRGKYQRLTPEQVRQATISGLYGAGYSPTPAKPAAASAGSGTTRNPTGP